MPKKRQLNRKGAETLRVPSIPGTGTVARVGSLLVVHGADVDIGRHVICDRPITIGREDDNELALCDGSISRRHCRVTRDETTGIYVVSDLGSTNGTLVNGGVLDKPAPLTEGDKIFIGSSVVRFSWADDVDQQYQSRVDAMVSIDALTGLASRRAYDAGFAAMVQRAEAEDRELSLLVIDLDGVKQVNDTHGHQMGGYVIAEASRLVGQVLAGQGLVCRWGGDELVACLPGVDGAQARRLAEEVRRRIAECRLSKDGVDLHVTVSIGVACWPEDVDRPGELFTVADRAMYRAKRSGRNQVVAAGDDGDGENGTGQSTLP
ncbi:MAG TPA: GGDEF domain-containing protein [Kofleriaceae bacterium]|nr:GGDEF domain-containing protein [Kofleriaceae bacterium]